MSVVRYNGQTVRLHVCQPRSNCRNRSANIVHPPHSEAWLARKAEEVQRGADEDLRERIASGRYTLDGLKSATSMSSAQLREACARLGIPAPVKDRPDRSREFAAKNAARRKARGSDARAG